MNDQIILILHKYLTENPEASANDTLNLLHSAVETFTAQKNTESKYKKAHDIYEQAKADYYKESFKIRKACLHQVTQHYPSIANERSYTECLICGKEVP